MIGELEKLRGEVHGLREEVMDLQRRIARMDRELEPAWREDGDLKVKIKDTHGKDGRGGIVFRMEGAEARKPLFEALLALSVEYGPVRQQRRELATLVRAYERRADNLEKYLQRKAKGRPRASPTA